MLNIKSAFLIFRIYLYEYYLQTKSPYMGGLLGDTILLEDGSTADPAAWNDWNSSVSKTIALKTEEEINDFVAYKIATDFLERYSNEIKSAEVSKLVENMKEDKQKTECWMQWKRAVKLYEKGETV